MVNHKSGKWGQNLHFQENHVKLQTHAFQWVNWRHSVTRDAILRRWGRLARNCDISSGSCQIEYQTPGKFQSLDLLLVTMLVLRYFGWLKTIFHMYIKWLITFLMTQKPSVLNVYKMARHIFLCITMLIFWLTQDVSFDSKYFFRSTSFLNVYKMAPYILVDSKDFVRSIWNGSLYFLWLKNLQF